MTERNFSQATVVLFQRIVPVMIACAVLSGCAGWSGKTSPNGPGKSPESGQMTQLRMEVLFGKEVDAVIGAPGAIQTKVDGINIYLVSDPAKDRMQMIAPIAVVGNLNPRILDVLLRANFQNTLYSRYAISEGIVYAAFIHPISSLAPDLLKTALGQVVNLTKTFGSTYSSGEVFPGKGRAAER